MGHHWSFESAGRIVFGPGSVERIGELLQQLGLNSCLLISDENLADHAQTIRRSVERCNLSCAVFEGGEAEPRVELVERVLADVGDRHFDAVVGLGGGSNIDLAKATAVVLSHGGAVADYAGQGQLPGPVLPIIAVPTTAGSGSEVSGACILSVPEDHSKLALVDNRLRPSLAIVDPELQASCPPTVTRDAGIDAFCHAVEALTIVDCADFPHGPDEPWPLYQGKHPFSDALAEKAIELIAHNLPLVVQEPGHRKARSQMALGALLAGMAMSNTGIYTVHALTYPVGAFTGASHGACNGVLLPAVLDFVAPVRRPEERRILELMDSKRRSGGDAVRDLLRAVGAPLTLRELGLRREQIEAIAKIGYEIRRLMNGSPRPTSLEQLTGIVQRAYREDD